MFDGPLELPILGHDINPASSLPQPAHTSSIARCCSMIMPASEQRSSRQLHSCNLGRKATTNSMKTIRQLQMSRTP
jgi:hypothetical protein